MTLGKPRFEICSDSLGAIKIAFALAVAEPCPDVVAVFAFPTILNTAESNGWGDFAILTACSMTTRTLSTLTKMI